MKKFSEKELEEIVDLCEEFLPLLFEAKITIASAGLPTAIPEVLGMTAMEGVLVALKHEDAELRRQAAFNIWDSLPDIGDIHRYKGFHIICDALGD